MFIIYILFFLFSIGLTTSNAKNKNVYLIIACLVLTIGAGWRSSQWADTGVYVAGFLKHTNTIFDYSFSDKPFGYSEKGFYFLGVLIKSFTYNYHIYLAFIAGLSLFFLYKGLRRYSVFPLIGLCAYIARFFMARNLIQIRTGLAYLLIIWGVKYIQEKKIWKYLLLVWIASLLHTSAWIALPLYFLSNWVHINKKIVLLGLGIAFIIGGFIQGPISSFIIDNASDLNVTTYTQSGYITEAKGLANPMIYFQCFLLLSYTFLERRIASRTKYYRVIRDGYFYSTLILISFCSFTALSGRTSTMFATLEFAIIPSLVYLFNKRNRWLAFILLSVALIAITYMNMPAWASFSIN